MAFFYAEMNDSVKEKQADLESTAAGLKDKADVYFIDIKDPKQRDLVNLYKVDRAPMPLVLVIAPNGAVTGGFPQNFPEDDIKKCIVGPLSAQCLKALQDQKLVFACVQSDDAEANMSAMKGVTDFTKDKQFDGRTEVIIFKKPAPSEQLLLHTLGVEGKPDEPVTIFLAPPGAMIGKFTGATDKNKLMATLTSKMNRSGGCCPAGSGKTCK